MTSTRGSFHERLVALALGQPKRVMLAALALLVALGSQLPRVQIDTDPENMLPADQGARVLHDQVKHDFTLYDMLVVGVVDEEAADGVFTPSTLQHVHDLTDRILEMDGVVRQEVLSLATVDNVEQDGLGVVRFDWLMAEAPTTREQALAVRDAAGRIPAVRGTLVSEDGRATAIYVPIESKDQSRRLAAEIREVTDAFDGTAEYHITGLPVAEDTFGAEMFMQMGVSAPLAGLLVLVLMWVFFRSWTLVVAPMLVAVLTVVTTMGLLIGAGFTVHIMSSMIPIFLMPIAVVDSVHILSEFADLYPNLRDRRETVRRVVHELFRPMLYTSLTSAAGFASLALTPIPPVRVFGVFVAIGIVLAFVFTLTFVPAYIVLMSEQQLEKLGRPGESQGHTPLSRVLQAVAPRTLSGAKPIAAVAVLLAIVSAVGISRITINDNPVRWFRADHEIRVADRVLNEHFAGTYNAFLVLRVPEDGAGSFSALLDAVGADFGEAAEAGGPDLTAEWAAVATQVAADDEDVWNQLIDAVFDGLDEADASGDAAAAVLWEDALDRIEAAQSAGLVFQDPSVLSYVEGLQVALVESGLVGKSTGVTDIVKTVHRELQEGQEKFFSIPPTSAGVAQTLFSYQSSHRPDDLWHFVTPDFRSANLWLQLTSGDNQHMVQVTEAVDRFTAENPPPAGIAVQWAGLTYLNVVWQQDMVSGMLRSLLGGFVIVFLMMVVLFRSVLFAALAMLPLSITIGFIYGVIGLVGKDYDMPVAVLSALTLGLSIDFAIHFLQRARVIQAETGNWTLTVGRMFAEPARAISRNAILIAIGFLPLLASPLVPYNTVGLFLAAIMAASGVVTLGLLPGVISLLERRLFAGTATKETA